MVASLFDEIERAEFSTRMNVVSGLKQLLRALDVQPEVNRLRDGIRVLTDAVDLLLRVYELTGERPGDVDASLADIAVTTYLRVLDDANPSLAWLAAKRVAGRPDLWWANRIAGLIRPVDRFRATHVQTSGPIQVIGRGTRMASPTTSVHRMIYWLSRETAAHPVPAAECHPAVGGWSGMADVSSVATNRVYRNSGTSQRASIRMNEVAV